MANQRWCLQVSGSVQGIGFRPFVYRLANELGLAGWVNNDARGVNVEVEGEAAVLGDFVARIECDRPAAAAIESVTVTKVPRNGELSFHIRRSDLSGARTAQLLPELATCGDCLAELFDPDDRRYRYPFTNCTHCGPRFSIQLSIPYDRPNTTMREFPLCDACRTEYEDPGSRRFHAQPNACPQCGPTVRYLDRDGILVAERDAALKRAASDLARGRIVATKGLGGYHLMADARNAETLQRLREGKPRREKPFALMVRDLDQARTLCALRPEEERALSSPEAPIVLALRRPGAAVDSTVAPGNPYLGLMLPYTPLHHLLLHELEGPVVATSGNLSDEPICIDETEALAKLKDVAQGFLVHDRSIARHVDDSVVCVVGDRTRVVRRARGFAPRPVLQPDLLPVILAVGGHLKNTVALSVGKRVFVSQHIGTLETPEALQAFEKVIDDFLEMYGVAPVAFAHDLHPDYASTRWAEAACAGPRFRDVRRVPVQHHHAHLASCLADNGDDRPALGVIWDGTGYGPDGTVWGGEFLYGDARGYRRVGRLRSFRLPGGDAAVREPRRSGLALLWEMIGSPALGREDLESVRAFNDRERQSLATMLEHEINSPMTTSAGRLFDGAASLLGIRQLTSFEGQAAMELEFCADRTELRAYPCAVRQQDGLLELDWCPLLEAVLDERRRGVAAATIAARFHNGLAEGIRSVARRLEFPRIALSGGCFQNRLLLERTVERLEADGLNVLLQRQVPSNDGGLSLGQVRIAATQCA